MDQAERARLFAGYHSKGQPIVLTNVWDAGSARAVAHAGAKAIATGSWSMAAAQGFEDGEQMPFQFVEQNVKQIVRAVALPVTVDLEGGYAIEPEAVADNVARIVAAGAVGINIEDGVIGGDGLHPVADQCRRIEAIRRRVEGLGIALCLNARTDLFLQAETDLHGALLSVALGRAQAYAEAGASCFFVPGLADDVLIRELCTMAALPVNIMVLDAALAVRRLAESGVARISEGPGPFMRAMASLKAQAEYTIQGIGEPLTATRSV